MMKFKSLMAFAMLVGVVSLNSTTASAQAADSQTTTSSQEQDTKQEEFVREWYDICFIKKPKDEAKCYTLSKELVSKYPKVQENYIKAANAVIRKEEYDKPYAKAVADFSAALESYSKPPQDASKVDHVFATGETLSKIEPDLRFFTVARSELAGSASVINRTYKNVDKVKDYVEEAIRIYAPNQLPKDEKNAEFYKSLRDLVLISGYQYLGFYNIEVQKDQQKALDNLAKAIAIKSVEGKGWKDPNNYLLRSSIYNEQYSNLSKKYQDMTDDQKTGDEGKKVLSEINDIVDKKLLPENARIIATTNAPETRGIKDATLSTFNNLWNFRTGAPEKAPAYLKAFDADPTVDGPAIPVKLNDSGENAPAPITTGPTKLSTSTSGNVPTGKANDSKTTKSKASTKGKRRRN